MFLGLAGAGPLTGDVMLPIPPNVVGTLRGARLGFRPGLLSRWSGFVVSNLMGSVSGRLPV